MLGAIPAEVAPVVSAEVNLIEANGATPHWGLIVLPLNFRRVRCEDVRMEVMARAMGDNEVIGCIQKQPIDHLLQTGPASATPPDILRVFSTKKKKSHKISDSTVPQGGRKDKGIANGCAPAIAQKFR